MASLADLADPVKRQEFIDRVCAETDRLAHEREVARFRATHDHLAGGQSVMVEQTALQPLTGETVIIYQDGPAGVICALPQVEFDRLYRAIPEETREERLERIGRTGLLRDGKDIEAWICGRPPLEIDEGAIAAEVDAFFGRDDEGGH